MYQVLICRSIYHVVYDSLQDRYEKLVIFPPSFPNFIKQYAKVHFLQQNCFSISFLFCLFVLTPIGIIAGFVQLSIAYHPCVQNHGCWSPPARLSDTNQRLSVHFVMPTSKSCSLSGRRCSIRLIIAIASTLAIF